MEGYSILRLHKYICQIKMAQVHNAQKTYLFTFLDKEILIGLQTELYEEFVKALVVLYFEMIGRP